MLKRIAALWALVVVATLALAAPSGDAAYAVGDVPNVRLTDTRRHTSDPAGLLSAAARDTIDATLTHLEQTTGVEVAVVMLPSIGQSDAFDFGVELFRSWGIGHNKANNGLLVLYVEDQRHVRFITGYGIEGTMTDAICRRIQERHMLPHFRAGDRSGGMVAGMQAVAATLSGETMPDDEPRDGSWLLPLLLLAGVIVMMLFATGILGNRSKRCPHCGKGQLRHMSTDYYRAANGHRIRKDVNICQSCGRVVVRNTDLDANQGHGGGGSLGALLTGMMLGSMFGRGMRGGGGGFGGGGFSGGSFGGGSTGGGGAGSNW